MMQWQLQQLLNDDKNVPAVTVTGMTLDSRYVHPGDLFIAIPGQVIDGRHYIKKAVERGAAAILAEASQQLPTLDIPLIALRNVRLRVAELAQRFYQHPSQHLRMIGVTGTNGKTSICHFVGQALGEDCGIIGTLGRGTLAKLAESIHTTPDVIQVQQQLAAFVEQGVKTVAMEVSSHGLDQQRVTGVDFDIGVFTNLTRDHLDYHQNMDVYGQAKKKLFTDFQLKHAIINLDDPFGRDLLTTIPVITQTWRYSVQDPTADIYTTDCAYTFAGISAQVHTPWGSGRLESHLLGDFNLQNILAAMAILGLCDVPFARILEHVRAFRSVKGRMQAFGGGEQPLVVVDYAHTPDALQHALSALRAHCKQQLWCVFGCGGDRDRGKRAQMGRIASQYADCIIVTDDNPRREDPARIIADIVKDVDSSERISIEHDREAAIAAAITAAQAGDVVLIAGKGHENQQIIGDNKIPFSDIETVEALLA